MSESKKESFVVCERNGMRHVWFTRRLWDLSKTLTIFDFEILTFDCFDEDVWFGEQNKPTVNKVLEHYRKIESANFEYPIILSQDGTVFDGVHRICKALLENRKVIQAVKFQVDPEPDRVLSLTQTVFIP